MEEKKIDCKFQSMAIFFFYIYTHIKDLKTIPNVGDFSPNLATLSKLDAGFEFHFVLNFKNQSKTFCPTLMVCQFCPKITPPLLGFEMCPWVLCRVKGQKNSRVALLCIMYIHRQSANNCVFMQNCWRAKTSLCVLEKNTVHLTHTHTQSIKDECRRCLSWP